MTNDKRTQAQNMYFQTSFTQAQIADLVGISHRSMSHWVNDGQWRRLKQLEKQMPGMMVDSLFAELMEINEAIRSREPGKRFANNEEAEIRRKMLVSMKYIKEHQSAGTNYEVLMNFIKYMQTVVDHEYIQGITRHADKYLKAEYPVGGPPRISERYTFHCPPPPPGDETPEPENDEQSQQRWDKIVTKFHDQKTNNKKRTKQSDANGHVPTSQ